jgi:hypothetical protein
LGIDERRKQKRGRRSPPFLTGRGSYRFLPPFFFPPFAAFLAIGLSPPSCGIRSRGAFTVSQRRCHQARRRCVHTPLVASFRLQGTAPLGLPGTLARGRPLGCPLCSRGSLAVARSQEELRPKKFGGAKLPSHPQTGRRRLALLAALFLAALCALLRHEFLLGTWLAQLLPVTRGYNRWAERSTLIQDVDYG